MKRSFLCSLMALLFISACGFLGSPVPTESAPIPPATSTFTPIPALLPTATPAPSLGTIALDFVALLCDAQWLNGGQHLKPCPAATADHSGGYAEAVDPLSEGLPAGTPTLLTIPAWNGFAALFLRYPSFTVHTGDRFRATLRCQVNVPCDVQYALEYYDAQGKYHSPFLSWNYRAGNPAISVDADLSALAGQTVDFVLTLRPENTTPPQQDYSLWIAPHIYRPNP
jgi:hypothetical protein